MVIRERAIRTENSTASLSSGSLPNHHGPTGRSSRVASHRAPPTFGAPPTSLLTFNRSHGILLLMDNRSSSKSEVPYGALDLMVLKTLDTMSPMHGYGIARRIEQISGDLLTVNQGTLYPVLLKLMQEGSIAAEW